MAAKLTDHNGSPRVVITEPIGAVTPLGNTFQKTWNNAIQGKSGVTRMEERFGYLGLEVSDFPVQIAAQTHFDPNEIKIPNIKPSDIRRSLLFVHLAMGAAAQLDHKVIGEIVSEDPYRVGTILGCAIGGDEAAESEIAKILGVAIRRILPDLETILDDETRKEAMYKLITTELRRVDLFIIPKDIIDIVCHYLAVIFQAHGPNFSVVSACASGAHSIGVAYDMIKSGRIKACITGGTENPITPLGIVGFIQLRALSTRNEDPEKASRPFDKDRDGFVLGQGACVIPLMSLETALKHEVPILAEIVGVGMTGDAKDLTAPDPESVKAAMRLALEEAKLNPEDVDYINPHATSTEIGDRNEALVIRDIFGKKPYISATKSMTGHLVGAAGAIELAFPAMTIKTGIIPPTINLDNVDPDCEGLNHVRHEAIAANVKVAISNSFGFGGHNCVIALKKYT